MAIVKCAAFPIKCVDSVIVLCYISVYDDLSFRHVSNGSYLSDYQGNVLS